MRLFTAALGSLLKQQDHCNSGSQASGYPVPRSWPGVECGAIPTRTEWWARPADRVAASIRSNTSASSQVPMSLRSTSGIRNPVAAPSALPDCDRGIHGRSPLILAGILPAFTIHPLPGGIGVSKLRFLDRRSILPGRPSRRERWCIYRVLMLIRRRRIRRPAPSLRAYSARHF